MELQNIQGIKLANGGIYNGWGFYKNGLFIPHGSGKLSYENYYGRGNFVEGLLDGPAIVSDGSGLIVPPKTVSNVPPVAE